MHSYNESIQTTPRFHVTGDAASGGDRLHQPSLRDGGCAGHVTSPRHSESPIGRGPREPRREKRERDGEPAQAPSLLGRPGTRVPAQPTPPLGPVVVPFPFRFRLRPASSALGLVRLRVVFGGGVVVVVVDCHRAPPSPLPPPPSYLTKYIQRCNISNYFRTNVAIYV